MDKLYLDVNDLGIDESTGSKAYSVKIIINGRPLIDLVREVELPFAQAEGRPELAGQYQNHFLQTILLPSRYLLPENSRHSTTLLVCGVCGDWGCWPLEARIIVEDERVIWRDFYQPHRNGPKEPVWRYDRLGPFVFDRRQYDAELGKMLADEDYQEAQRRWEEWLDEQAC